MERKNILILVFGGGLLAYYFYQKSQSNTDVLTAVGDDVSNVTDTIKAAIVGWKNVGSAATWLPYLAQAESQFGIPTDLLSRVAYQESRFREEIIRGTKASPVGALGIMQMMPQYFTSVNAPRPYADSDVIAQIQEAGKQLASLYKSTGDWTLALAGYNAGLGNVQKYGAIPPFKETQDYVAQITADVPLLNA
jgi:soluble lytic murein transglycosylase-like protein